MRFANDCAWLVSVTPFSSVLFVMKFFSNLTLENDPNNFLINSETLTL